MPSNSNWFKDVREVTLDSPQLKNALTIDNVASGSPGQAIGLKPGDYLMTANGKSAHSIELNDVLVSDPSVEYVFYRAEKQSQISFVTEALPLGVRLSQSSENIALWYKSKRLHEGDGLRVLWERGEYEHIRAICSGGLLGKLMARKTLDPLRDAMLAICDLEAGKNKKKAYAALEAFRPYENRYTSDYSSLVRYYLALKTRDAGDMYGFKNQMHQVMESNHDCARIKADADAHKVAYVPAGKRLGTKYTFPRSLPYLEGGEGLGSLSAIVKTMSPDQVLPICFMMTFRGNGPFNDDLKSYRAMYPHCKDKMLPMLVLTNVAEKRADRPHWFETEEALIKAGIPITVLLDESALFADGILSGAPEYICVNNKSTVVWDSSLYDDYAYWTMLSEQQST